MGCGYTGAYIAAKTVIPAKAGIHETCEAQSKLFGNKPATQPDPWTPACAGVTAEGFACAVAALGDS
jgi:hypothetical protein